MLVAAVDLGNTRAKIAFYKNGELISFERRQGIEDLHVFLAAANLDAIAMCSVSRTIEQLEQQFGHLKNTLVLKRSTPVPIKVNYKTPDTLGLDRLAAAVGAASIIKNRAILICDFGTAIKYDYVNAAGEFVGGIISPGKRIRFEALHTFTKRLPLVSAEQIPPLVGVDTVSCIQSGVVNGIVHEANGTIASYLAMGDIGVILTGGDAPFFEKSIKRATFVVEDLVHKGLIAILHHNKFI
jgi:type III pantothenate kinase